MRRPRNLRGWLRPCLRDVEYIVCRTGEVGREVRHEIQSDDHQDKADDERLHHIAVRDGQMMGNT